MIDGEDDGVSDIDYLDDDAHPAGDGGYEDCGLMLDGQCTRAGGALLTVRR